MVRTAGHDGECGRISGGGPPKGEYPNLFWARGPRDAARDARRSSTRRPHMGAKVRQRRGGKAALDVWDC